MSEDQNQASDGVADEAPRVSAPGQPATEGGASGVSRFAGFVSQKSFLIVGVVVALMAIMIGSRGCSKQESARQNLGVKPPTKSVSDPNRTSDYVADGIKERDAAMAEAIAKDPRAISAGTGYIPEVTREWSDPLADYASATSRSTLTDTVVSGPTPPPVARPQPSSLEKQAGNPRAEKMLLALKAHTTNGTSTLAVAADQEAILGTWVPGAVAPGPEGSTAANAKSAKKLANLGDLIYAVLDFEANSDYSKFVQATAVAGPFAGAKFQGSFSRTTDRLEIVMNRVNWRGQTYSINAIATNPENPEVGLATDVNYHYIQRFGGVITAAMVGAYGREIAREGTTIRRGPLGETDIEVEERSDSDLVKIGVGEGALELRNALRSNIDRPPTVVVAASTPIGIVLTTDWMDIAADQRAIQASLVELAAPPPQPAAPGLPPEVEAASNLLINSDYDPTATSALQARRLAIIRASEAP